jgi:hypothetical protein
MSMASSRKKPDPVLVSQVWLHIYAMILQGLEGQPGKEQLATYAANAIIKEVDFGYAAR